MEIAIIFIAILLVIIGAFVLIRYVKVKSSLDDEKKFFSLPDRNRLELIYCDIGDPFIEARYFKNDKMIYSYHIDLYPSQVEKGKITNIDEIVKTLKEHFPDKYSIVLYICSDLIFNDINSLPKINFNRAVQLKNKEIKNDYDKYKENYKIIENSYKYNLGIVFNDYFVPSEIINSFRQIAKGLNSKISKTHLYGEYLFSCLRKVIKNDYAFIYTRGSMATFILVNNFRLVSCWSFKCESAEDVIKTFVLIIGKHELEIEKKVINEIYYDSEYELSFGSYVSKKISLDEILQESK